MHFDIEVSELRRRANVQIRIRDADLARLLDLRDERNAVAVLPHLRHKLITQHFPPLASTTGGLKIMT